MRYTASAAMEDRTLRDVERWKDKIEIRLDNRQVFFLFFGSALVACLLFILGVVVGKRLESRGRAAAPEIEDPLALLDRIAASPGATDDAITFPRTLIHSPPSKEDKVDKKVNRKELAQLEARPAVAKPAPAAAPAVPAPAPKAVVTAPPEPVAPSSAPKAVVAPAPPAPEKLAEPKPAKVAEKAAEAPEKKGKFALQLGSFQSREEADAFMAKFAAAGPYIVVSDIPEKGRWYRVRVGNFDSSDEAMQAKAVFERAHHQIAYVAPR